MWVGIHISTQSSSTELTDNTACSCLKKIHLSSTECQMKAKSGSDLLFGGQMLKHYRGSVRLPWGPAPELVKVIHTESLMSIHRLRCSEHSLDPQTFCLHKTRVTRTHGLEENCSRLISLQQMLCIFRLTPAGKVSDDKHSSQAVPVPITTLVMSFCRVVCSPGCSSESRRGTRVALELALL